MRREIVAGFDTAGIASATRDTVELPPIHIRDSSAERNHAGQWVL